MLAAAIPAPSVATQGSYVRASKVTTSTVLAVLLGMGGIVSSVAQGLPGGASNLTETHGDWRVNCVAPEGAVRCGITQIQVQGENRQRVLAVELTATEAGQAATGALVLPFGLRLDDGAVVAVDEGAPTPVLRFSTCLPAGCLVPLSLDQEAVAAMRAGTKLSVTAVANDTGRQVTFPVSLNGFGSALARAAELTAN